MCFYFSVGMFSARLAKLGRSASSHLFLLYMSSCMLTVSGTERLVFGMFSFRFSFRPQECAPLGPRQRDPAYSLVLARQQRSPHVRSFSC